ncbi:MAG: hypothetical protein ACKERG_04290 [Candidatus Hodgkinia cicadicola]
MRKAKRQCTLMVTVKGNVSDIDKSIVATGFENYCADMAARQHLQRRLGALISPCL